MVKGWLKQPTLNTARILNMVRLGHIPYGILNTIEGRPYAQILLERAGGYFTAISPDASVRESEREAARAALRGRVAVDTSVAALVLHADLDASVLSAAFNRVLIADELLVDAQRAVNYTGKQAGMSSIYEPMLDDVLYFEITPEQEAEEAEKAANLMGLLKQWNRTPSSRIRPGGNARHEWFKAPWDASVRVASDKNCPLWCDDIVLRQLAEAEGVLTFGTYALYEVLTSEGSVDGLPGSTEMKMRLLRARIADIPISLTELQQASDELNFPDIGVDFLLGRPAVWRADSQTTLRWYLDRVSKLGAGTHRNYIPKLLFSASCGLGSAELESDTRTALPTLLGDTLLRAATTVPPPGLRPELSPELLTAARCAARAIDPRSETDPLSAAVHALIETLEDNFETKVAAQIATLIFSQTDPVDKIAAATILLGSR